MLGIIIATCLWNEQHFKSWLDCKKTIKQYHPTTPILVVLDDSSTVNIRDDELISVIKTKNCASDMYMYASLYTKKGLNWIKKHKITHVITLQDSMRIKCDITSFPETLQYLWYFTNHRIDWEKIIEPETKENIENKIVTHDDLVLYCINNCIHNVAFQKYANKNYNKKNEWIGCFGCLCIVNLEFLYLLQERTDIITTMKLMGKCNRKRRAIESIFSLAVKYMLNDDIPIYDGLYFDGKNNGHRLQGEKIEKISFNRNENNEKNNSLPRIIATGDSHSIHYWKIPYITEHWLGFNTTLPITINRLGKEGLDLSHIPHALGNGHERFLIKPGDTVMYFYGYNDLQYRVFEQVEEGRLLDEILSELVKGYLNTLLYNEKEYGVFSCVSSIPPPPCKPIEFKVAGTTQERISATHKLNRMLQEMCIEYNFKYLDTHTIFVDKPGTYLNELSKDGIHLNSEYWEKLEKRVRELFPNKKEILNITKKL